MSSVLLCDYGHVLDCLVPWLIPVWCSASSWCLICTYFLGSTGRIKLICGLIRLFSFFFFVDKVLLKLCLAHLFIYYLWLFLLNSCHGDYMAHKLR